MYFLNIEVINEELENSSPNIIAYKVWVVTSDVEFAGTDANVYLQLFGPEFETGKIPLMSSKTHKNMFEKGHTDYFELRAIDVGELTKLR